MNKECKGDDGEDGRIHFAFDRDIQTIAISAIVPLKSLPEGARESRKFAQVLSSIRAIGLVEAPVVIADTRSAGTWYLLDGHLRLEALKELGFAEVECLVATDDDTYTYNKRVNRLAPIQEHRMIARTIERGVSSADIADALGLQVESVIRRFRLLEGISPEVAEMPKDTPCSMKVFDVLRQMNAVRQNEAADLMIGQHNFTLMFARAIRAATPHSQLVAAKKMTGAAASTPSGQQIARMERELAALQTQVKASRKLTASTICILPSHADTLPSSSPTLASPGGFRVTAKNILGSFRKSLRSMRSVLSRRPWRIWGRDVAHRNHEMFPDVLLRELRHRMKNMLGLVLAIARQTMVAGRSGEECRDAFLTGSMHSCSL